MDFDKATNSFVLSAEEQRLLLLMDRRFPATDASLLLDAAQNLSARTEDMNPGDHPQGANRQTAQALKDRRSRVATDIVEQLLPFVVNEVTTDVERYLKDQTPPPSS